MKKKSPFKGDLEGLTNVSFVTFVTITFSIHLDISNTSFSSSSECHIQNHHQHEAGGEAEGGDVAMRLGLALGD